MNPHEYAEALCVRAEQQGLDNPTEGMIADMLGDIKFNFDQEKKALATELTRLRAELETERRKVEVAMPKIELIATELWNWMQARNPHPSNIEEAMKHLSHLKAALTPSEKGEG